MGEKEQSDLDRLQKALGQGLKRPETNQATPAQQDDPPDPKPEESEDE